MPRGQTRSPEGPTRHPLTSKLSASTGITSEIVIDHHIIVKPSLPKSLLLFAVRFYTLSLLIDYSGDGCELRPGEGRPQQTGNLGDSSSLDIYFLNKLLTIKQLRGRTVSKSSLL